jgi:hypothetical protein
LSLKGQSSTFTPPNVEKISLLGTNWVSKLELQVWYLELANTEKINFLRFFYESMGPFGLLNSGFGHLYRDLQRSSPDQFQHFVSPNLHGAALE